MRDDDRKKSQVSWAPPRAPGRVGFRPTLRSAGGVLIQLTDQQVAEVCAAQATRGARTGPAMYEWHGGGTNGGVPARIASTALPQSVLRPLLAAADRRSLLRCDMMPAAGAAFGHRARDRCYA